MQTASDSVHKLAFEKEKIMAMLKTLTVAVLSVAAASVTAGPASAGRDDDCIKIAGKYYLNGNRVDKCPHAAPFKVAGDKHYFDTPSKCVGKPSGYRYLGDVNGKPARITC